MKQVVLVGLVLVGLLLTVTWALQRRLIYLPSEGPVPEAHDVIDGAREVTLGTSDGLALGAWFVPPRASGNDIAVW